MTRSDEIDILYDSPIDTDYPFIDQESLSSRARKLSERLKKKISIKFCKGSAEFLREINGNPNYQVIIIHMGGGDGTLENIRDAYNLAQRCRGITDARLVAESVSFGPTYGLFGPERNDADYVDIQIRKYFDAYMGLMDVDDFGELLKQMGFVPSL